MIALMGAAALWLAVGLFLAAYGFATEDHSDLRIHKKALLAALITLLWPFAYLPSWPAEQLPVRGLRAPRA